MPGETGCDAKAKCELYRVSERNRTLVTQRSDEHVLDRVNNKGFDMTGKRLRSEGLIEADRSWDDAQICKRM